MNLKSKAKSQLIRLRMFFLSNFPRTIRLFYTYFWQPKPNSLAAILHQFSKSQKEIFFIQVGSNDGFQHDPLCKFIKRDHWNGILLEPQKSAFRNLTYIYKKDAVIPLNYAVDRKEQQRKLYKIAFSQARWATGLSSFNEAQLQAMIKSGHIDRQCAKSGIEPPKDINQYIDYDLVHCISFESLIKTHKIDKIDLLHIDTEGFDYEILKLFPFSEFLPQIVLFEHSHLKSEDLEAARIYLQDQGYELEVFGADTMGYLNLTK